MGVVKCGTIRASCTMLARPAVRPNTAKSPGLRRFLSCQHHAPVSPFRINTCKNVSKQGTLTLFRMNTYEKPRGVGPRERASVSSAAKTGTAMLCPYKDRGMVPQERWRRVPQVRRGNLDLGLLSLLTLPRRCRRPYDPGGRRKHRHLCL
jgi:hypothetical protein